MVPPRKTSKNISGRGLRSLVSQRSQNPSGQIQACLAGPYKVQTTLPNNTVLLVDPRFYDPQAAWVNINKLKAYHEKPPQQQMTQSPFDPTNPAFNDQIGILWIPPTNETSNPDDGQPISADSSQTDAAPCYAITVACPRTAPLEATLADSPHRPPNWLPGHQGQLQFPAVLLPYPTPIRTRQGPHPHQITTCRKLRPRDQHHKPLNYHRAIHCAPDSHFPGNFHRRRHRATITRVQPPSIIYKGTTKYIKSVWQPIPTRPTLSPSGDPFLQLHTGRGTIGHPRSSSPGHCRSSLPE